MRATIFFFVTFCRHKNQKRLDETSMIPNQKNLVIMDVLSDQILKYALIKKTRSADGFTQAGFYPGKIDFLRSDRTRI